MLKRNSFFSSHSVICGFSLRREGNMSLCYGNTKKSLDNRRAFLEKLRINADDLVCAEQTHSDEIKYAQDEDRGKGALSFGTSIAKVDGFITDRRQLPLAIFTADCLSVFLYDVNRPAAGVVHAGWKSSKKGIASKALGLMREKFNSKPQDLLVAFGPAMRACCYKVKEEFADFFPGHTVGKKGSLYLDLIGVNKVQLLECGVQEKNIFDCGFCTYCGHRDFFSFRLQKEKSGRMISVIMLR